MHLSARDQDKPLISSRPIWLGATRGLNYLEAVAVITADLLEGARDGRSVAELMSSGKQILHRGRCGRLDLVVQSVKPANGRHHPASMTANIGCAPRHQTKGIPPGTEPSDFRLLDSDGRTEQCA
jgi:urease gamma subunit